MKANEDIERHVGETVSWEEYLKPYGKYFECKKFLICQRSLEEVSFGVITM